MNYSKKGKRIPVKVFLLKNPSNFIELKNELFFTLRSEAKF